MPADPLRLTTERLTLRPLHESDAPALHAAYGDAEAMRFWDSPELSSEALTAEMIARQCAETAAGTHLYWAVERGGALIGSCDLSEIDRAVGEAEVGFIFVPAAWGRGFAREAMEAVVDIAFGALALRRLAARIHAGNAASERLLAALGFRFGRRLPAAVIRTGEARDCELWALEGAARPADGRGAQAPRPQPIRT